MGEMKEACLTRHNEDWYAFWRMHFKTGYIDLWKGDCAHDPNGPKPRINLNAMASYYRLNDGLWENSNLFQRGSWHTWRKDATEKDATTMYNEQKL